MPRVSIVVLDYNGAPYIERLLLSLKAQTFTGFDLVLFDNCSTDWSLLASVIKKNNDVVRHSSSPRVD
jgi:glycosyltransferase involved in cell wall biosynthesis